MFRLERSAVGGDEGRGVAGYFSVTLVVEQESIRVDSPYGSSV
jgi:hypothetical protein